jgi:hypothetical protein
MVTKKEDVNQHNGEGGSSAQVSVSKTKSKIPLELLKTLPDLKKMDPESVLDFLIWAQEICD